jgi:hypothetical protein
MSTNIPAELGDDHGRRAVVPASGGAAEKASQLAGRAVLLRKLARACRLFHEK